LKLPCFFVGEVKLLLNKKNNRAFFWNSRKISIMSLICFITVLLIILLSNILMNTSIKNEAEAQRNRYDLKALGETLAEASDYLTDEVRKYAITGDIEHLYNYWYEVNNAKRRDIVINTLTGYNPPENELKLIAEAKRYSDILIEVETYSMKMAMLSRGQEQEDYKDDKELYEYVSYVMDFELPLRNEVYCNGNSL